MLPVSEITWTELVNANKAATENGWAEPGVFATGIGRDYVPGASNSVLYVGKSAGPLGSLVGSGTDQTMSARASTRWMEGRVNKSAFWQMIDLIDRTRRSIAWTNVCKMDRTGGSRPPGAAEWASMRVPSLRALKEEISTLRPKLVVFATSDYLRSDIFWVLENLGLRPSSSSIADRWTSEFAGRDLRAIVTKQPQGWMASERDAVVAHMRSILGYRAA